MTDEQKRALMGFMASNQAANEKVLRAVYPAGTARLLLLTWAVGVPGLMWMFSLLSR
jgi:hypothetical protein